MCHLYATVTGEKLHHLDVVISGPLIYVWIMHTVDIISNETNSKDICSCVFLCLKALAHVHQDGASVR
jgi:hypothetical protein